MVFIEIFIDEVYNIDTNNTDIKTIIDAGANIGLTSLYYAVKYPHAIIYALEPESNNYNQLLTNVDDHKNIIHLYLALTDEDKTVTISESISGDWGFKLGTLSGEAVIKNEVQGISMQSLIAKYNLENIGIFKIDIEGAEINVLNGNTGFFQLTDYMVIELHPDIPGSTQAFINCVNKNTPKFIKDKAENLILKY